MIFNTKKVLIFSIFALNLTLFAEAVADEVKDPVYIDLAQSFAASCMDSRFEDQVEFFLSPEEKVVVVQSVAVQFEENLKTLAKSKVVLEQDKIDKLKQDILQQKTKEAVEKKIRHFNVFYKQFGQNQPLSTDNISRAKLSKSVLEDFRILSGSKGSGLVSLLNKVFAKGILQTTAGRVRAAYELSHPITDKQTLENRQATIRWLTENPDVFEKLDLALKEIAEVESTWTDLWFMPQRDMKKIANGTAIEALEEQFKFQLSEWCFNSRFTSQDFTTINIVDLPNKILNWIGSKSDLGMNLNVNFWTGVFLLQTFAACKNLTTNRKPLNLGAFLWTLLICFYSLKIRWINIKSILSVHPILCKMKKLKDQLSLLVATIPKEVLPSIVDLDSFLSAQEGPEIKELLRKLDEKTFSGPVGFVSNHGRMLRTLIKLDGVKNRFAQAMKIVGQLDFYMAAAKMVKNSAGQKNAYCFVELVDSPTPIFECRGMWNQFLGPDSVENDLIFGVGSSNENSGIIVSGPNFGGKSKFTAGMPLAALSAQCLGIAPAESLKMTIFDNFVTFIFVSDDACTESRLSAELEKMKEMLNIVIEGERLEQKTFVVGDEFMSSTKPKYSQSLIRAVLKKLVKYRNSVFIFATHFDEVVQNAPQETGGRFKVMKACSIVDEQGFYQSPTFKVEDGISPVDSAFSVAERKFGEDHADVVADAKQILLAAAA